MRTFSKICNLLLSAAPGPLKGSASLEGRRARDHLGRGSFVHPELNVIVLSTLCAQTQSSSASQVIHMVSFPEWSLSVI